METKYIIGLLAGIFIYVGIVSGLYLAYKPDIEYQKERRRKAKEARQKALELAKEARKFQQEQSQDEKSEKEHKTRTKKPERAHTVNCVFQVFPFQPIQKP